MFDNEKKILVYGGGVSGKAVAKYLVGLGGAPLLFYDDFMTSAPPVDTVDTRGLSLEEIIHKTSLILVSPSVSLDAPLIKLARNFNIPIDTELSFSSRLLTFKKIAITGTDGKTTVTTAVTDMLKRSKIKAEAMGNIGNPVSDYVDSDLDCAVIEVSSFQLAWAKAFHPDVSTIINIAPDHLNWHKNFKNYLTSKYRVFEFMDNRDTLVLNLDDCLSRKAASLARARSVYFSLKTKADARIENDYLYLFEQKLMPVTEVKFKEGHHLSNALCSSLTAYVSGASIDAIRQSLIEFSPPPHRMELIYEKDGLKIINDSKATTPHATISALNCLSGSISLILGGSDKGEDYNELFNEIAKKQVNVICVGSNQQKIEQAARSNGVELLILNVLSDAIAAAVASGADNILFSPASASFDRYKNYEERGNVFKTLVKEMLF